MIVHHLLSELLDRFGHGVLLGELTELYLKRPPMADSFMNFVSA
jgi:hypothetical protein